MWSLVDANSYLAAALIEFQDAPLLNPSNPSGVFLTLLALDVKLVQSITPNGRTFYQPLAACATNIQY